MDSTAIEVDWVGQVIDSRFPLLEELGGSPEAGVFLTQFGDRSQRATIKLIPADAEDAETRMTSWLAAANLSHPNLMRVLASGRFESDSGIMLYVVTEYADEVLAEIIPQRALTPQETREMLGPALDALSYLHGKGFVHGRLKPSNIMAVGDQLKLSSDGLLLAGAIGQSSTKRTVYDAPEIVQGRVGTAADVWSLGATLVEILTQRRPAWYGSPDRLPEVPETVPEPFAEIARECMRLEPARRCTVAEIKARLWPETIQPAAAKKPGKPAETSKEPSRKSRTTMWIGAAALLLAAIAVWQVRSHQAQTPPAAAQEQSLPAAPSVAASASAPAPAPAEAAPTEPAATQQPAVPATAEAEPPVPATNEPSAPKAAGADLSQAQAAAPQAAVEHSSSGATTKGAVAQQVEPDVLASALRTISGTVKVAVRVTVDAGGKVTGAEFADAGPSKYFAGKAVDAAQRWTFKPAEADGQARASIWILRYDFRQSGVTVTPEETEP